MDGRIVSVKEFEDLEGYGYREIVVKIIEPIMPCQDSRWVPDWRALQEQQSRFSETVITAFEEYEEAMRRYDRICDELDALHIGGVAIVQVEG